MSCSAHAAFQALRPRLACRTKLEGRLVRHQSRWLCCNSCCWRLHVLLLLAASLLRAAFSRCACTLLLNISFLRLSSSGASPSSSTLALCLFPFLWFSVFQGVIAEFAVALKGSSCTRLLDWMPVRPCTKHLYFPSTFVFLRTMP